MAALLAAAVPMSALRAAAVPARMSCSAASCARSMVTVAAAARSLTRPRASDSLLASLASPIAAAGAGARAPARTVFVRVQPGLSPSGALEQVEARMQREGTERRTKERERYLKPKYERQYNAKAAIYGQAKKRRMALVEAMMADSHITPF